MRSKKTTFLTLISLAWLLLFPVFLDFVSNPKYFFISPGILGFLLFLSVMIAIVGLIVLRICKSGLLLNFGIGFSIFVLLQLFAIHFIISWQIAKSIENANPIIRSLSEYKVATGSCPESLDKLVPDYIPDLPKTSIGINGYRYFYRLRGENCSIGFEIPGWKIREFSLDTMVWREHD